MSATILIPWQDRGCPHRRRALDFVQQYYAKRYSVVIPDSSGVPFRRAALRNLCVKHATDDIVVVMDADLVIPYAQLNKAIELAKTNPVVVKPYDICGYMTLASSDRFCQLDAPENATLAEFEHRREPYHPAGGVFVMQRKLWLQVGGMDERFEGWGQEDNAFMLLCEHTLGPAIYLEGPAFHIFHPSSRRENPNNALLIEELAERLGLTVS